MTLTVASKQAGTTTVSVSTGSTATKLTLPVTATTLIRVTGGPPGPRGPAGTASLPAIQLVAAQAMRRGTPVAINRALRRFCPADAAIYNLAFVVGLLKDDCDADFIGSAIPVGTIELVNLLPGSLYYLAEGGGLAAVPPTTPGSSVVVIGHAITASTLDIRRTPPVLL